MIKQLLTIAILLAVGSLNAQKPTKSKAPYTAKDGTVYQVGDTIILASPTDFSNNYSHVFQGNKRNYNLSNQFTTKIGDEVRTHYRSNTRHTIKQFRIFEDGTTYAVIDNLFNYMVDLDKAMEMNEIFSEDMKGITNEAIPEIFTDSIAFLQFLKRQGEITPNNVKEYLYNFDYATYKNVRNDEFAFHERLNVTKEILKLAVKNTDASASYFVGFDDEIGNYDFDRSSFPVAWNNNGGVMIDDYWERLAKDNLSGQIDLTDLRIYFTNTADFAEMPLHPERARFLINHRKAANGNIDRKIYMGIQFEITDLVDASHFTQEILNPGEKYLLCKITRIDFFEDPAIKRNYLSTVKQ
jgi:hypothetical protein